MFTAKKLDSTDVALVRKNLGYSVALINRMLTDSTFNVFGIYRQGGTWRPAVLVPVIERRSDEALALDFRTLEDLTKDEIVAALNSLTTYYRTNKVSLDPKKLLAREEYELLSVLTCGREKDSKGVYRIAAAQGVRGSRKNKQEPNRQPASRFL